MLGHLSFKGAHPQTIIPPPHHTHKFCPLGAPKCAPLLHSQHICGYVINITTSTAKVILVHSIQCSYLLLVLSLSFPLRMRIAAEETESQVQLLSEICQLGDARPSRCMSASEVKREIQRHVCW